MTPVSPDTLAYRGPALDAFDELARSRTCLELFNMTHSMWCGNSCPKDINCTFLHFNNLFKGVQPQNQNKQARSLRHRYNKDTAQLFTLMGGEGYESGIPQKHHINFWPSFEATLRKIDKIQEHNGLMFCDYTDWTKKQDSCAGQTIRSDCRDILQWLAIWVGAAFNTPPVGAHMIAFVLLPDDLCVPPLDLVNQRFRMYGRSLRDLIKEAEEEGWGQDATRILLAIIRLYTLQYIEKLEFEENTKSNVGIHVQMSQDENIWDSIVFRTHTSATYICSIVVGQLSGAGALTEDWLIACAINDAISMDLGKSALRVYKQDNHNPTASSGPQEMQQKLQSRRQIGYHSVYLDLMDGLVRTGCPEPLVNFASAGLIAVQMNHRYLERSMGFRFPIHQAMADEIRRIFGDKPSDAWLDGLFHLQWLVSANGAQETPKYRPTLCPDLLAACQKRQQQRVSAWTADHSGRMMNGKSSTHESDIQDQSAKGWVVAVHNLAQRANSPDELQNLLVSTIAADPSQLTVEQLRGIGSQDDIWALCMACRVDCSGDCEWLAFAKYAWRHVLTLN